MLYSLLYFEVEGYFNVPTVISKCLKALGNIPVIRTFYQLMWTGGDSTQRLTGLANQAAPGHGHSLVGVPCCWTVDVGSCLVWGNPTSLCNGWSQTTPKHSLEVSNGGTSLVWRVMEFNCVDVSCVGCPRGLRQALAHFVYWDVAIELKQHALCQSGPKISYFLEAIY